MQGKELFCMLSLSQKLFSCSTHRFRGQSSLFRSPNNFCVFYNCAKRIRAPPYLKRKPTEEGSAWEIFFNSPFLNRFLTSFSQEKKKREKENHSKIRIWQKGRSIRFFPPSSLTQSHQTGPLLTSSFTNLATLMLNLVTIQTSLVAVYQKKATREHPLNFLVLMKTQYSSKPSSMS